MGEENFWKTAICKWKPLTGIINSRRHPLLLSKLRVWSVGRGPSLPHDPEGCPAFPFTPDFCSLPRASSMEHGPCQGQGLMVPRK